MADPRISHVELDEATIVWRNADIEQERRIAIFDLIEENTFRPVRAAAAGFRGTRTVCGFRWMTGGWRWRFPLMTARRCETHRSGSRPVPPANSRRLFRDLRFVLSGDSPRHRAGDRDDRHGPARGPQRGG